MRSGTERQKGGAGEQRKGRRNGVGAHTEGAALDPGLKARGEDGRRGRAGVRNVAGQHMPSHTHSCATRMRDGLRLPACCCLTIQSREELV